MRSLSLERRHVFCLPELALAAVLAGRDGTSGRVAAGLLVVDCAVQLPRWPLPRAARGAAGYWLEAALTFVPFVVLLPVGLATSASWATAVAAPWWFGVAAAAGIGFVAAARIDLRALFSGTLAFLAGPQRRSHVVARGTGALVAPVGEEAMFRGVGIGLPGADPVLVVLSSLAFVSRHHTVRGVSRSRAAVVHEVVSSAVFVALAAGSGSIYPALLAHLLNNMPQVVLEAQIACSPS